MATWIQGLTVAAIAALLAGCLAAPASPERSRIIKVLPQFLDREGLASLSPSLYERDAYQDQLRRNEDEQFGLRFHVLWKTGASTNLRVRVEVQGSLSNQFTSAVLDSGALRHGRGREWSSLEVTEARYRELGRMIAWRASLWDGERQLAEQKSFLW